MVALLFLARRHEWRSGPFMTPPPSWAVNTWRGLSRSLKMLRGTGNPLITLDNAFNTLYEFTWQMAKEKIHLVILLCRRNEPDVLMLLYVPVEHEKFTWSQLQLRSNWVSTVLISAELVGKSLGIKLILQFIYFFQNNCVTESIRNLIFIQTL